MSEIIDINIFPTSEEVALTIEPNLITITVNEFTGGGAVTSVNGLTGDVIIGVSDNNFTDALETKLNWIEAGAEVNVNADWNATSGDAQILNKPSLSGYVPYTGATQNVNLGEFGAKTGHLEFDTTPTNAPTTVGSLVWNDIDGTLDLKLKGGAVTLQIGQETLARIVNKTSTNVTLLEANYQAVRITGAQGQRPKVDLALANNDLNSASTLGLVTETILNNNEGFVTTSGQVREINTTGSLQGETWADGDVLYLSGTIAGQITNVKPFAPIHTIIIGFVEYAHAVHGKIFVKIDNGYELNELHNVDAILPNNNEALIYNETTNLWTPKLITNTDLNLRRNGYTVYNEFLSSISNGSYALATVATGTITTATNIVNENHFGVVTFNSSATANSGFYSALNPSSGVHFSCTLAQKLQCNLIFRTPTTISPTTTIRFGVGSGTITSVEYASGFYFEIIGDQLVGKVANVNVRASTSAFTILPNTWYHLRIIVTSLTIITYYVYAMDGTLLAVKIMDASVNNNNLSFPTTTIVMNQSVIATNSVGGIGILGYFDYIGITFPPMERGALN